MRPRTKHICIRMHHFREHVRSGAISVHKIPSRYQLADIATKPQPDKLFIEQRESLMQWRSEDMTREELMSSSPAHRLRACEISRDCAILNEASERAAKEAKVISTANKSRATELFNKDKFEKSDKVGEHGKRVPGRAA